MLSDKPPLLRQPYELPIATGDYSRDCAAGRAHAHRVTLLMLIESNPNIFVRIAERQIAPFNGVQIGFFTAIGEMAAKLSG